MCKNSYGFKKTINNKNIIKLNVIIYYRLNPNKSHFNRCQK